MTRFPETRRSCAYFPSRSDSHAEAHGFLLARDIPLGIMPIRHSQEEHPYSVTLDPPNDARAEWIRALIDIGPYSHHSLDEAVSGFVETAAHYLGLSGEMRLEITGDSNGKPSGLAALPPGRVLRLPRAYLQWVPSPDRNTLGTGRFVSLERERVWHLRFPSSLGSPKSHRRLLRRLEAWSNPTPDFAMNSRAFDLGRSAGFEFSRLHAAYERETEWATKRWGTILSFQRPVGESTEYFFIARRLEFHRAQASLRDHLLDELRRFLARLGVTEKLVIAGLTPPHEIAETLHRLHAGEISFGNALDAGRIA